MDFPRRFRETLRERGLAAALRYTGRAAGRLVYRRETLIMAGRNLDGEWPDLPLPEGYAKADVHLEDLPALIRDLALDGEKTTLFRRRLEAGVPGLATRGPDGSFVYVTWFGWGDCPDPESPYCPPLAADEALLFDSYTRPDARRKGLHKAMNVRRLEALRRRGFQRAYVLYYADNVGARKAQARTGLLPARRIVTTRVVGLSFTRTAEIKST